MLDVEPFTGIPNATNGFTNNGLRETVWDTMYQVGTRLKDHSLRKIRIIAIQAAFSSTDAGNDIERRSYISLTDIVRLYHYCRMTLDG